MIDSIKLKRIQIKKDEVHIAILDIKKAKRKMFTYLGLFVLAIAMVTSFEVTSITSQQPEADLLLGKGFMQFAGIVFWMGIFLVFRIFSIQKEIKELEREYKGLVDEVRHHYN